MDQLKLNFQYYLDHQDELVKKYNGKYLIIKDCAVVGDFFDESEAYVKAVNDYGLGNFLLQYCSEGVSAYTQTFVNSYVRF